MQRKGHFGDRDKVLSRVFKIYVNKNLYNKDEYHDFCKFAKGKSESKLLRGV